MGLKNKERLAQRDYEDIIDIFGEDVLAAFEKGEGKLPVIKEQEDVSYINTLYKKLNPTHPFGIMSILEWSFAYTGFVECVESEGDDWNIIPTSGAEFETLQTRLTLESEGGNIVMRRPVVQKEEEKPKNFFGRIFG